MSAVELVTMEQKIFGAVFFHCDVILFNLKTDKVHILRNTWKGAASFVGN